VTALETFRRLGAAPWTRRAESELRACGVTVQVPQGAPGALDGLTAQQREIVVLARRTRPDQRRDRRPSVPVPPHLYRSYPKLGIAGRRQLRDIIDQRITPRAGR
ncbi:LuxR family transcriptional regulator, partial [Streptomyces mirabilis]